MVTDAAPAGTTFLAAGAPAGWAVTRRRLAALAPYALPIASLGPGLTASLALTVRWTRRWWSARRSPTSGTIKPNRRSNPAQQHGEHRWTVVIEGTDLAVTKGVEHLAAPVVGAR